MPERPNAEIDAVRETLRALSLGAHSIRPRRREDSTSRRCGPMPHAVTQAAPIVIRLICRSLSESAPSVTRGACPWPNVRWTALLAGDSERCRMKPPL